LGRAEEVRERHEHLVPGVVVPERSRFGGVAGESGHRRLQQVPGRAREGQGHSPADEEHGHAVNARTGWRGPDGIAFPERPLEGSDGIRGRRWSAAERGRVGSGQRSHAGVLRLRRQKDRAGEGIRHRIGRRTMTAGRPALPAVALALALVGSACPGGCGSAGRPDVLPVVIDTARADRFSFDGYARQTSPEIATLASEGTIYEQAYTPARWTLPAHARLFTGLFPSFHGADSGHLRLEGEFRTLAEIFHDAGYRTLGYAANPWVGRQYGLDQGFDTYEEIWKDVRGQQEDAGAGELNARLVRFLEWRAGD